MTHDQIKALLRRYYDDSLEDEKRLRICAGENADAAVRRALHLTYGREIESAIVEDLAIGRIDAVSAEAASLLARNGIAVDAASPEFRTLCYELLQVQREIWQRVRERDAGNYSGEPAYQLLKDTGPTVIAPDRSIAPSPTRVGPSLADLVARFMEERRKAHQSAGNPSFAKYEREFRDSVSWFNDFLGGAKRADQITKADVVAYKAALSKTPTNFRKHFKGSTLLEAIELNRSAGRPTLSTKSINAKRLGNLSTLFGWAVSNDVMSSNPAHGVRIDEPKASRSRKRRDPFTIDQLRRMFDAPLYRGCQSPSQWKISGNVVQRDHRFWLPLLALWTGARLTELAQLFTVDVRQDGGRICLGDAAIMPISVDRPFHSRLRDSAHSLSRGIRRGR